MPRDEGSRQSRPCAALAIAALAAGSRRAHGRRPPRPPSIRESRPSRRAASAPPTSSTPTPAGTYIGQAAHCASTGAATDTDGCLAGTLPLGTPVEVTGASRPGTLVYSSWVTMQANGESDPDTCAYNDLALVKIDPADVGKVNPSVPGFGGPTGVGGASAARRRRLLVRQLVAAPRHHPAEPEAGQGRDHRGRRLEPHRVHRHAGHPGRLGQRLPERLGSGDRRRCRPSRSRRCRPRTAWATSAASSPTPARTARSRACRWRTARSPSRRTWSARSWAPDKTCDAGPRSGHYGSRPWLGASQPCPATGSALRSRPRRVSCWPRSAISSWRST